MPGDIFYSQVDANLQTELNARGRTGRYGRTTRDMQFMLEKIANVQVTPFKKDGDLREEITAAILGGTIVRSGEYLPTGPNGFLTDRNYTQTTQTIESDFNLKKTSVPKTNSSRRIPPFITSCDVAIGDNSNGLLNTSTINITIPNPERDLEFIESVYFRPGRDVRVKIQHPDSVMMSDVAMLTDETMPSVQKLRDLYPNIDTNKTIKSGVKTDDFRKMNTVIFEGLITSFTMDYQPDMSVVATIQLIGNSQVYTDISLLVNPNQQTVDKTGTFNLADPKLPTIGPLPEGIANQQQFIGPISPEYSIPTPVGSFYTDFDKIINNIISKEQTAENNNKERGAAVIKISQYWADVAKQSQRGAVVWGDPTGTLSYQRYVTLSLLIQHINTVLISKIQSTQPLARIICDEINDLCTSTYYENLVSSDPMRVYMVGDPHDSYGGVIWNNNNKIRNTDTGIPFSVKKEKYTVSYPSRILINMEVIQEIIRVLEQAENFTVATFLSEISKEIYEATGTAIDMRLITHPVLKEFLLFYDAGKNKLDGEAVVPYSIPMFSNHPNGTVVREFKFSAKLPSDASSLAYVVGQDASQLAESDIAPYVAYMYAASTVERSGPHESVGNLITQEELNIIKQKYKDAHVRFKLKLQDSKSAYSKNPSNKELSNGLRQALEKYIQYPKETILDSNQLTAPVMPFETEFTIDGINGFRYGDVITFDGLPTRYKRNAVFCIVGVTHTVATDGQWTTTIRCIMRPNIDVQA